MVQFSSVALPWSFVHNMVFSQVLSTYFMPGTVRRAGDRTLNRADTGPTPEELKNVYSQLEMNSTGSIS